MDTSKQQQAMASVIAQLQAKLKDSKANSQRAASQSEETRLPASINPSATDPIHDPLMTDIDSGEFGNTRSGIPDSTPMKTPANLEAELVRSRIMKSIAEKASSFAKEASRAEEARQKDKSAHDEKYSHVVNELFGRLPDYPL